MIFRYEVGSTAANSLPCAANIGLVNSTASAQVPCKQLRLVSVQVEALILRVHRADWQASTFTIRVQHQLFGISTSANAPG